MLEAVCSVFAAVFWGSVGQVHLDHDDDTGTA